MTSLTLFIQIPAYNEEHCLPVTLRDLPRQVPGVADVKWLVIDDGSTDGTADVAQSLGADYVLRLPSHQGLARAFQAGIERCVALGADIIVNTDADHQYRGDDIARLIRPLLEQQWDMTVGVRDVDTIVHFSALKRRLQKWGSRWVCWMSGVRVSDTRSGFRAFTRDTAEKLRVHSRYTYTLETLMQAGAEGWTVATVPIRTNPDLRPSRLIQSLPTDLVRSGLTVWGSYARLYPLRAGSYGAGLCTMLAVAQWSSDFSFLCAGGAFLSWAAGLVAEQLRHHRVTLENLGRDLAPSSSRGVVLRIRNRVE